VLSSIDPFQFGGIPRSSATKALISMVHTWTQATDGTGNAVRVVLFDYKKAFDLIKILATKIIQLPMPTFIKRWVIDFLMKRVKKQETVCLNGLTFLPVSLKEPNWDLGYSS
jgi:hypothetical protein